MSLTNTFASYKVKCSFVIVELRRDLKSVILVRSSTLYPLWADLPPVRLFRVASFKEVETLLSSKSTYAYL